MEVTCELFDRYWTIVLGVLLLFSALTLILRVKFSRAASIDEQPQSVIHLFFWGKGFVAILLLYLMVMGFVCAGSPGDLPGIVPN